MQSIGVIDISHVDSGKILSIQEGHFVDLKAIDIQPAKLTRSISAFSNAEGGELYVGIDDDKINNIRIWRGFSTPEDANGHIQIFEKLFPLGDEFSYSFLSTVSQNGLVLKIEVRKSRSIKTASNGKIYVRRGAQNLPVDMDEEIARLRRNKGLASFETETVNTDPEFISNSTVILKFMIDVIPNAEPEAWLRKQQLIIQNLPTVSGIVLFAEEPQALLPKRSGIKLYRYKTTADEGTRDTLDFDPISIDGCAYEQIRVAVNRTVNIIESIRIRTSSGLENVKYPPTALHEVITNAILHRDYSIADDIHIRIFDNRVEVISPGTLPAHITPENILEERFSRNGSIVRIINKFPDPPNKDVGEGLNTAFLAMREMKLKDPIIEQTGENVRVILRHEPLGTPEEIILEYLQNYRQIANREAREICFIGSENQMKRILQNMVKNNMIEQVPGTTRYTAAYRLKENIDTIGESDQPSLFGHG